MTTIHGFSDPRILPAYRAADSAYVSISDADRVPELDYCATVYHGIDLSRFAFSATPGEDLVILGRIHPDKGTAEAIEIARRCGRRLLIAGPVQDEGYFAAEVAPHVDDDRVCYLGSVGPEQRSELLAAAAVLLHPIAFAEPFGLAVVEAMAAGTPVVAYARGSMPEVVDEGVTGFLVHDAGTAVAAVDRAVRARSGGGAPAWPRPGSARTGWSPTTLPCMNRSSGDISGALFQRYRGNPILSPNRWPYTVNAVMNAGAAEVNGTTVLLCRVEDRRGISHLTVARSADGLSNWVVEQPPLLEPEPGVVHESWGVEDPG